MLGFAFYVAFFTFSGYKGAGNAVPFNLKPTHGFTLIIMDQWFDPAKGSFFPGIIALAHIIVSTESRFTHDVDHETNEIRCIPRNLLTHLIYHLANNQHKSGCGFLETPKWSEIRQNCTSIFTINYLLTSQLWRNNEDKIK